VTTVSHAGRRRGRGKGASKKIAKDLNKGQVIGIGKKNVIWPGLNAPILKGREVVERKELAPDLEYQQKLVKMRDEMDVRSRIKVHPLERGWSGNKMHGRWIGPPDPIVGEEFVGFDTKVLFMKPVFCMKANFGKTKRICVLTVTGNRNGLAGFAIGKARDARTALKKSKNKAGQRLRYIELDDGHTVLHDFYSRFGFTKVYVRKMPKGYGLVAHRCIRGICETLGITDIHCKVEGSEKNYLNLTRAFFLGLIHQKSFQQMADEKGLHVIEFREDRDNYPVVRASPSGRCRTDEEISSDEILDFHMYLHDGKVRAQTIKKPAFYTRLPEWQTYLKKWHYYRSRDQVRVNLIAKYGALDSFVTVREKQRIAAKRAALIETKSIEADNEQKQEVN